MKPILILQHLHNDGPAYLRTWLLEQGLPFEVRNTQAGDEYPDSMVGHSALAVLGGEMSANDPLPSLRQAEQLIRDAMAKDLPVIGHCLGGQLMARALGAAVKASSLPEIGWHAIEIGDSAEARRWLGDGVEAPVFQWHEESFDIPPGATLLAGNESCPNQAFSIGQHLAMQFHVELDEAKLEAWCEELDRATHHVPTQHSPDRIRTDSARWLQGQHQLADRIYRQWLGLPVRVERRA
ncbi:type 1 glutamine amidotransferase [Piscinibacter terrae]|uniref:Type 1 glutamine amidotransferase n=1 Tax=Piscinibacter terrae TaxID=2496871 RepID=A0A3N7HNC5_9BURK|nr:type 1 glutamine amidotransferase [Albitalea terrae]RQP22181.1 type 1 glutamine amidotransferase [Albitalea terrae]